MEDYEQKYAVPTECNKYAWRSVIDYINTLQKKIDKLDGQIEAAAELWEHCDKMNNTCCCRCDIAGDFLKRLKEAV